MASKCMSGYLISDRNFSNAMHANNTTKHVRYQGTTSVVPHAWQFWGFSPCDFFLKAAQRLKPIFSLSLTARLKSCPVTFVSEYSIVSSWSTGIFD